MYIYETGNENISLLLEFAKENRKFPTDAESVLWNLLKGNNLDFKFRRQHVIGNYIADFVNLKFKVIIEIDGGYHLQNNQIIKDIERSSELEEKGFYVLRFTNEEVLNDTERVLEKIKEIVKSKEANNNGQFPLPSEGVGGGPCFAAAWAVDAACSGNPGPMEYRGIDLATGAQVFHFGPVHGTNNIGEFLAIVHALALMEKLGITDKVIYSDSYNAILWVNKKQCKTKLPLTPETAPLFDIIRRAEQWLRTHSTRVPIIKWDTQQWGEVPADFGRK